MLLFALAVVLAGLAYPAGRLTCAGIDPVSGGGGGEVLLWMATCVAAGVVGYRAARALEWHRLFATIAALLMLAGAVIVGSIGVVDSGCQILAQGRTSEHASWPARVARRRCRGSADRPM